MAKMTPEYQRDYRRAYQHRVDGWLAGNNTHKDKRDKKD
jgi:hypothetical protein